MHYQLKLNETLLREGDFKSLMVLYNGLTGSSFARTQNSNWLNKMSATESYSHYLNIMAKELGVTHWEGRLTLSQAKKSPEKVFIFETHEAIIAKKTPHQTSAI